MASFGCGADVGDYEKVIPKYFQICTFLLIGACGGTTVENEQLLEQGPQEEISDSGGHATFGPSPTIRASAIPVVDGDTGDSTISISVTLSIKSGGAVNVTFASFDGSAKSGVDY